MIAAMAQGFRVPIYKASVANQAAGYVTSLWRAAGSPAWAQGAIPSAAATPTDDTVGGIPLPDWGTMTGRLYRFAPLGVPRARQCPPPAQPRPPAQIVRCSRRCCS